MAIYVFVTISELFFWQSKRWAQKTHLE